MFHQGQTSSTSGHDQRRQDPFNFLSAAQHSYTGLVAHPIGAGGVVGPPMDYDEWLRRVETQHPESRHQFEGDLVDLVYAEQDAIDLCGVGHELSRATSPPNTEYSESGFASNPTFDELLCGDDYVGEYDALLGKLSTRPTMHQQPQTLPSFAFTQHIPQLRKIEHLVETNNSRYGRPRGYEFVPCEPCELCLKHPDQRCVTDQGAHLIKGWQGESDSELPL